MREAARKIFAWTAKLRERFSGSRIVSATGRYPPPPRAVGQYEAQLTISSIAPHFFGRDHSGAAEPQIYLSQTFLSQTLRFFRRISLTFPPIARLGRRHLPPFNGTVAGCAQEGHAWAGGALSNAGD